jgi:hypothetical protein
MEKRGHVSDQHGIWKEVARKQAATGTVSNTSALHDTFTVYRESMGEFYEKIQYPDGASGMVVGVGKRVVCCDLFDKPSTCKAVWNRLLSGFILDALETEANTRPIVVDEVETLVRAFNELPWKPVQAVGDGEEYRAASPDGDFASTLCLHGSLIHGSLVRRC